MEEEQHAYLRPMELFHSRKMVTVCAPMVRYSKLAFRSLVRMYGCDLCYTPMITSDTFLRAVQARHSDFTTSKEDRPLIVQFAAKQGEDWARATELVALYCDGVDLNCGCPQRWAMAEGYGACLIHKPHLVSDMVRQTRASVSQPEFTVSVKIRIHDDLRRTVDFAQQMEAAGISFIAIHGRTQKQRSEPVCTETIATVKSALSVPVVANGGVRSLEEACALKEITGADGIMTARGILENPAMYAGYIHTPLECVREWVRLALSTGTPFTCFHHHLIYMLEHTLTRAERRYFNILSSTTAVLDYLSDRFMLDL
ncbi:tRNA-dihydrouridine(20a/20b) synthase [NAD(P)+]-like [Portunus trituberculatus]|uniref:tRNA-dihydrouridine(20a/20b) synthase [NAD(P)+]-like n=1 Tax=Portunus trituberculatus TaxID=210409 RepID=UPI001E1CB486|nr:tRNA-dihydrouridine(20a/20b) synthase [NAD(P)+]-like [Portunus trituberculatus]XP_045116074.1 tRNA-dihydrouridine(20a/20b) synthase [NAD(P)+]-like [Portunus trituberculatus]XP_045116075.1 tRNA-dihydrouridine(20a/20b) synthase [NAD(P)+]-like [Portunus trituberculatus]XP_045116076.1 tRNA-dihydrouridine(20a/20b) synthase [NAD(P)+]-like [Portunus trituberculatus]